jgi:hypothetical protein
MSEQVPTDEQLARIERGVHRRIDRRRSAVRGITGGAAALAIVAGGFALVVPAISGAGSASSAGSGGSVQRYAAADDGAVRVVCHGTARRTVQAAAKGLPGSAEQACAAGALRGPASSSEGAADSGGGAAAGSASAVCRADDGVVHVYVGSREDCDEHGMTPVTEP